LQFTTEEVVNLKTRIIFLYMQQDAKFHNK
jgi:hypothetical protein